MQGSSNEPGPPNSPGRSNEVAILVVGSPLLSAGEMELSPAESTRVKKRKRQQEEVKKAEEQELITDLTSPQPKSVKKPKSIVVAAVVVVVVVAAAVVGVRVTLCRQKTTTGGCTRLLMMTSGFLGRLDSGAFGDSSSRIKLARSRSSSCRGCPGCSLWPKLTLSGRGGNARVFLGLQGGEVGMKGGLVCFFKC
jgi:hypothetical protein